MAHPSQQKFFEAQILRFASEVNTADSILEIGSQNINGSVRNFFSKSKTFLGIDLGMARDVDWTIPGELIELPDAWADIIISTECFEHCETWREVFLNIIRISKPGALIFITCAGVGRTTHGTSDSDVNSSPFTTNYYKNLRINDIAENIELGLYFLSHGFEINSTDKDLYFWGVRSNQSMNECDSYWEDSMTRLARCQGQLGQAAERQSAIQYECNKAKAEVAQAKAEAEQANAEAEQAKAEAEQAKAEVAQAKAEAEQAKAEAEQANAEAEQVKSTIEEMRNMKTWKAATRLRRLKDILFKH